MIRAIFEPKVKIVAKTAIDVVGMASFLDENKLEFDTFEKLNNYDVYDAETLSEFAGRLCYMSFNKPRPGGNSAYLDHIKEARHGSVTEHSSYTFLIEDVSKNLTHELVRHRIGSYSQLSDRYCARDRDFLNGFVVPDLILESKGRPNHEWIYDTWLKAREANLEEYLAWCHHLELMLDELRVASKIELSDCFNYLDHIPKTDLRKWIRGAARSVLPGCAETKILATYNIRVLRHIFDMRGSDGADQEICRLAIKMWELVKDDEHFKDITLEPSPRFGNRFYLKSKHLKV